MVEKTIAIEALDELLTNLGPYIYGLDTEEIGELYMKSLNKINGESKCVKESYMD